MSRAAENGARQSMLESIGSKSHQSSEREGHITDQYQYGMNAAPQNNFVRSSPASGEESVAESIAALDGLEDIVGNSSSPPFLTSDLEAVDTSEKETSIDGSMHTLKRADKEGKLHALGGEMPASSEKITCNLHALDGEMPANSEEITCNFSAECTSTVKDNLDDPSEIASSLGADDKVSAEDAYSSTMSEEYDTPTEINESSTDLMSEISPYEIRVPPNAAFITCQRSSASTGEISATPQSPSSAPS
eukprot:11732381-Ditylum_brightwellii.AAC.1